MKQPKLSGKTALLTGASRGIGVSICKTLAKEKIKIIGVARSREGLEETASIVRSLGSEFFPIPFDLSQPQKLSELVSQVKSLGLPIDFLINNAGIEYYAHFQDNTSEELASIINTNLLAPMELTRLLLPSLHKFGGHIVNMASLAGKKGVIYNGPYSASKAGLIMWTDALRQELAGSNVGISVICPGYIAEAGMFFKDGVTAPAMLGTSSPDAVAQAVLKASVEKTPEIIVNKGPIRPLLAFGQLFPSLADWVVSLFGIKEMNFGRIRRLS